MKDIVEYRFAGGAMLVEVTGDTGGLQPSALTGGGVVRQATQDLDQALANVEPGIRAIGDRFRALEPDSLEIEFGLKFTAKAGVIIASGEGEASFKVTCKWGPTKG